MRSLLARMLAVSLGVAVMSIVATTVLITRTSGETVRGVFEQTLEADSFVYQRLLAYAHSHDSWTGVDAVVDQLAEEIGDRVALTTLDGTVLADSASRRHVSDLPPTPTAEVDAREVGLVAVAGMHLEVSGGFAPIRATSGPGDPGSVQGLDQVAESATVWRLSESEVRRRETLAADANQCFADAGISSRILVADVGTVVVSESTHDVDIGASPSPSPTSTPRTTSSSAVSLTAGADCVPVGLAEPSDAAISFNDKVVDEWAACLADAEIDHVVSSGKDGLRTVVPPDDLDPDGRQFQTYLDCFNRAHDAAVAEAVAEPALLYVGSTDRFDPLSGDGWAPMITAGTGVLAVAAAVTAVSGRRLTRPIRALTTAAQRMGAGDRTARVPVSGHDEVTDLGRAFNSMAESIAAGEENRKAMVSDIAHELRTPLSNVRGYLEAAEDGVVPIDVELITSLREESDLLRHLVDDLQSLALADSGALRIHPVDVDASDLARQVVSAHRAAATDGALSLSLDPSPGESPDADDLIVRADPTRMRQALGNIVGNAIRYTPPGGTIVVTVSRSADTVTIAVADDGPGIPAEHLDRVFDRFHRVEGSRSRDTGGSGLGLPIARSLVEAHGGTVGVISTEGEGSTFTITLPRPRT